MKKKILNVCHIVLTFIYLFFSAIVVCIVLPVQAIFNALLSGLTDGLIAVENKYCREEVVRYFRETLSRI